MAGVAGARNPMAGWLEEGKSCDWDGWTKVTFWLGWLEQGNPVAELDVAGVVGAR